MLLAILLVQVEMRILAETLELSLPAEGDPSKEAAAYVNETVPDADAALQGARDILAEAVSDNAQQRLDKH